MENTSESQEDTSCGIQKQNIDRSMRLVKMLLSQMPQYPYVFLGNNRHAFGEDQYFKTEQELNDFAKLWETEVVKPKKD
jgi:hypothetical protein